MPETGLQQKKVIDLTAPQQHNDLKITVLLSPYNGDTESI